MTEGGSRPGRPGRILALDYGDKRIGMAVTDDMRTMVFPRPVLENHGWEKVAVVVRDFCVTESVTLIVIGCPFDDAHVENEQTERVRSFGAKIAEVTGVPVVYEDEKYTTAEAEAMLDAAGLDFRDKKMSRDSVAAMLILQSCLSRV